MKRWKQYLSLMTAAAMVISGPVIPAKQAKAGDSYRLTECILNAYCEKTGFANLGIQYHDDMTGINWSKIPVMILEMGFMTNEHDDTAMQDAQMQTSMVNGIADGIDQYFGR